MSEQESGDKTRYNFKHIYSNFYVVRTHAGLRRAIKHFRPGEESKPDNVFIDKMKFPSVVSIFCDYQNGSERIYVQAVHVNRMMAAISGE